MHWEMLKDKVGNVEQCAEGWGQKAIKGIESSTGLKVGDVIRQGQEKVERQKEKLQGNVKIGSEPVKVQTVGYVVETRPVAEIVAPVTSDTPATALNARAEVEKPAVIPAAAAAPAVAEAVAPAAAAPTAPFTPVDIPKPVDVKKPEENKRLV